MLLSKFYNLLDAEIEAILAKYTKDSRMARHKDIDHNKGYALLVWFLEFYAKKEIYENYITDGNDDSSCDIIFSNKNVLGEKIYYVVQSKWVKFSDDKREDAYPRISKQEFGYTLTDFSNVLSGNKQKGKNEDFNRKYDELEKHLEDNGKVKFIFFTLADGNEDINESLKNFNTKYSPNISLEVIDIQRIRRDFIEFRYKEIQTNNPLEYNYNSEETEIEIEIEREKNQRDVFEFVGREKAFIFTLRPKVIFDLFQKYRFSLFFKNVRNPLHHSNYNEKIVKTLLEKPTSFWFFNNGVTAITKVMPDIGLHAKKLTIGGLQIINGAQTVYSVYYAYLNASHLERQAMDSDARISFRLVKSSDLDFNLEITRYTNMQNPMEDRDFWANDEVQLRLQNESFKTNLWYEKRRDEFRGVENLKEKGINIYPNKNISEAYLLFYLQLPFPILGKRNKVFVSRKDDKEGLYEVIFNQNTRFEDMIASSLANSLLIALFSTIDKNISDKSPAVTIYFEPALSISKTVMQKYFNTIQKSEKNKNVNLSKFLIDFDNYISSENNSELNTINHNTR